MGDSISLCLNIIITVWYVTMIKNNAVSYIRELNLCMRVEINWSCALYEIMFREKTILKKLTFSLLGSGLQHHSQCGATGEL